MKDLSNYDDSAALDGGTEFDSREHGLLAEWDAVHSTPLDEAAVDAFAARLIAADGESRAETSRAIETEMQATCTLMTRDSMGDVDTVGTGPVCTTTISRRKSWEWRAPDFAVHVRSRSLIAIVVASSALTAALTIFGMHLFFRGGNDNGNGTLDTKALHYAYAKTHILSDTHLSLGSLNVARLSSPVLPRSCFKVAGVEGNLEQLPFDCDTMPSEEPTSSVVSLAAALFTTGSDAARTWDAATGGPIQSPGSDGTARSWEATARSAAWAATGEPIQSPGSDGTARSWEATARSAAWEGPRKSVRGDSHFLAHAALSRHGSMLSSPEYQPIIYGLREGGVVRSVDRRAPLRSSTGQNLCGEALVAFSGRAGLPELYDIVKEVGDGPRVHLVAGFGLTERYVIEQGAEERKPKEIGIDSVLDLAGNVSVWASLPSNCAETSATEAPVPSSASLPAAASSVDSGTAEQSDPLQQP